MYRYGSNHLLGPVFPCPFHAIDPEFPVSIATGQVRQITMRSDKVITGNRGQVIEPLAASSPYTLLSALSLLRFVQVLLSTASSDTYP